MSTAALLFIDLVRFGMGARIVVYLYANENAFYVDRFLLGLGFCALAVATHMVERDNLLLYSH